MYRPHISRAGTPPFPSTLPSPSTRRSGLATPRSSRRLWPQTRTLSRKITAPERPCTLRPPTNNSTWCALVVVVAWGEGAVRQESIGPSGLVRRSGESPRGGQSAGIAPSDGCDLHQWRTRGLWARPHQRDHAEPRSSMGAGTHRPTHPGGIAALGVLPPLHLAIILQLPTSPSHSHHSRPTITPTTPSHHHTPSLLHLPPPLPPPSIALPTPPPFSSTLSPSCTTF